MESIQVPKRVLENGRRLNPGTNFPRKKGEGIVVNYYIMNNASREELYYVAKVKCYNDHFILSME